MGDAKSFLIAAASVVAKSFARPTHAQVARSIIRSRLR
jgi:ribonuclease HII